MCASTTTISEYVDCPACNGSGKDGVFQLEQCYYCEGDGTVAGCSECQQPSDIQQEVVSTAVSFRGRKYVIAFIFEICPECNHKELMMPNG